MPYAFAHPAAVIPVAKVLGRHAVPSALAIGSLVPDAWYLVPYLERPHSHDFAGALWFCLPLGCFFYVAFHLVLKEPLLALLPQSLSSRLATLTPRGLPGSPATAVMVSLLAGIATHLAWDALTHRGLPLVDGTIAGVRVYRILQHGSTLLGTAFLAAWIWARLRDASTGAAPTLPRYVRIALVATFVAVPALVFFTLLDQVDGPRWRTALRGAAVTALCTQGLVVLAFCVAWRASGARGGR